MSYCVNPFYLQGIFGRNTDGSVTSSPDGRAVVDQVVQEYIDRVRAPTRFTKPHVNFLLLYVVFSYVRLIKFSGFNATY